MANYNRRDLESSLIPRTCNRGGKKFLKLLALRTHCEIKWNKIRHDLPTHNHHYVELYVKLHLIHLIKQKHDKRKIRHAKTRSSKTHGRRKRCGRTEETYFKTMVMINEFVRVSLSEETSTESIFQIVGGERLACSHFSRDFMALSECSSLPRCF